MNQFERDLREKACEAYHNTLVGVKTSQWYHAPHACPCREQCAYPRDYAGTEAPPCVRCLRTNPDVPCDKCDPNMVAYSSLPEEERALIRIHLASVHYVYVKTLQERYNKLVELLKNPFEG